LKFLIKIDHQQRTCLRRIDLFHKFKLSMELQKKQSLCSFYGNHLTGRVFKFASVSFSQSSNHLHHSENYLSKSTRYPEKVCVGSACSGNPMCTGTWTDCSTSSRESKHPASLQFIYNLGCCSIKILKNEQYVCVGLACRYTRVCSLHFEIFIENKVPDDECLRPTNQWSELDREDRMDLPPDSLVQIQST
jgi:hypothetical protein